MKRLLLFVTATVLAAPALLAQATRDLELRAYYHDPIRPAAAFQLKDGSGKLVPLGLMSEGLSDPVKAPLADNELILYSKEGGIAARAKVAASIRRAAVIIVPAADAEPPCRMLVVDDSPAAFPWGSSMAVSLFTAETAVQAGEHRIALPGGKVTPLPEVKKVDEFNMAQTNFYYRERTAWVPFTERRLQYTGELRRIFLIHATTGSQQPFVATLTDYKPQAAP